MKERCEICGHPKHEKGECKESSIEDGCICGCCYGGCTCDHTSWEYSSTWPPTLGGRRTKPE